MGTQAGRGNEIKPKQRQHDPPQNGNQWSCSGRQAGKTLGYRAVAGHPLLKAFRVFENQLMLQTLVQSLGSECRQIILFGSCATGEDLIDNDIDLFVLTDEPDTIREKMKRYECERELNPVVVDPAD